MTDRSHLLTELRLPESMNLDAMSVDKKNKDGRIRLVRWLDERFPQGVRVERTVTSFEDAGGIG